MTVVVICANTASLLNNSMSYYLKSTNIMDKKIANLTFFNFDLFPEEHSYMSLLVVLCDDRKIYWV